MAIKEVHNLTLIRKNGMLPRIPFSEIKESILGKKYVLSINFVSPKEALTLNKTYRQKDYIPNILSFPLSENEGEIYICLSVVRKGAKEFSLTYQGFLHLIVIHGCLHLKGHDHSSTMEELEETYLKKLYREEK
jgi:rRNA maturation RNase YbeY